MAKARRPKGKSDKVRLRPGSHNYYVRLQYPKDIWQLVGKREYEFSLGVSDYREALILSKPYILRFELEFEAYRSVVRQDPIRCYLMPRLKYEPGRHPQPDGSCVIATQTMYIVETPGEPPRDFPNVQLRPTNVSVTEAKARLHQFEIEHGFGKPFPQGHVNRWADDLKGPAPEKPKAKKGDDGAVLIQHWIDDNGIKPPIQREAWRTWNLFQELNGGKRLSEITREDATKLRHHMLDVMGLSSSTVMKNCGHLRAAFRLAAAVNGYKGDNPFVSLVSKKLVRNRGDSIAGEPYSEAEMAIVRRDLHNWREDARLLWVLCATTGMRPGEAFLIHGEVIDCGLRCIDLLPRGRDQSIKTKGSQRRLPIPSAALPFLPARIEGKLFKRSESAVMHWTNRRLEKLGLIAEAKSLKSLRHRAVNRLNNITDSKGLNAPPKLPEQICGHALEGVHNQVYYKKEHPIKVVKKWIDLIGY